MVSCVLLIAVGAFAQTELNPDTLNPHVLAARGAGQVSAGSGDLTFHGGNVLRTAKVVLIFWGPSFKGADASYASSMVSFRNNFGTTKEFNVITQYYGTDDSNGSYGNILAGSLVGSQPDWYDTSQPPTKVTDSTVQSEVKRYIQNFGVNYETIYEVFIPSTSYSSSSGGTSCGGPHLQYCAYHSHYNDASGRHVKYSIEPWAGCSGCSSFNNVVYDQEHFVCHETREAVTDPLGNAWYDAAGYEADDKCAWNPAPFLDGGFGYQYEYANNVHDCVKTQ
jgi:hypothetical protein